jgi:hypothetical protein
MQENNKMESVVEGYKCVITLDFDIIESERLLSSEPLFMIWAVKLLVVEDNAMNQMVIKMINKNG